MAPRVEPLAAPSALAASLPRVSGFRRKVLIAIMVVVTTVTIVALFVGDRNLAATTERELQRSFEVQLETLRHAHAIRHAALVERCRALVRKPRIHAALEDNALDLLYLSAEDELRDVMVAGANGSAGEAHAPGLRAKFYRFLDSAGRVIVPPGDAPVGLLDPAIEAALALPRLDDAQHLGYVRPEAGESSELIEVLTTPIISGESGEPIAALALGFRPLSLAPAPGAVSGVWAAGQLQLTGLAADDVARVARFIASESTRQAQGAGELVLGGQPHRVFYQRLNPGSLYPPAYEVSVFALAPFTARRANLRFQIVAVGALLLLGAYFASRLLAARLSAPVEKLAVDSERSARFSADASHQLKTPVTVLRAGLEELLTRENLTAEECHAIDALVHQTYRLSNLIDDLLLLSRMDAGRLRLTLGPVDLGHLIAGALDDLSALPDEMALQVDTRVPTPLFVAGERGYTAIILQNLLENARKYNRPGGRISIVAERTGDSVFLRIGNTGRTIEPAAQAHIFERFHRGAMGENVPGYGLGLNLAWELMRLHEGELRLLRSADDWTEFQVRFRALEPPNVLT